MVVISRQLSPGYYDHPPLSFWLAHAASWLGGEHDFVVRLPFVALFALTTWLMYRLTARLFGEAAGVVAALLLNVSAVFAISTGGWVLPDGPLMCALLAATYGLVRALFDADQSRATWWWIGAGIACGFGLLSKYHAGLFMMGAFVFLLARPSQRHWLRRPAPYLAAAIAFAMFSPDLVWNARHAWVSFGFQLGRNASASSVPLSQRLDAVGLTVAGQAAWVLPWIWIPMLGVGLQAATRRPADDREWLLLCLGLGPLIVFTLVSLNGRVALPHWPAPGYLMFFPLLGAAATGVSWRRHIRWVVAGTVAFLVAWGIAMSAVITGWLSPAASLVGARQDPTVDLIDWREISRGLDSLGVHPGLHTFVASTSWIQAAKVSYALGPGVPVLCLSPDPKHFAFLSDERGYLGQDAIILSRLPERRDVVTRYQPYFDRVDPVGRIAIHRAGRVEFSVGVYLARDFRVAVPQSGLPEGVRVASSTDGPEGYFFPVYH